MSSKFTNELARKLKNGVQQPTVPKQQAPVYIEPKYEPPMNTPPVKDPFLEGFYEDEIKAGLFDESKLYVQPYETPKLEEHYKVPTVQEKLYTLPTNNELQSYSNVTNDYNDLMWQSNLASLTIPQTNSFASVEITPYKPPKEYNHLVEIDDVDLLQAKLDEGFKNFTWQRLDADEWIEELIAGAFRFSELKQKQEERATNFSETKRVEALREEFLRDEYEGNAWADNAISFGTGNHAEVENLGRRFGFGAYLATVDRSVYGQPVYNGDMDNLNGNVDAMARIIFHEDPDPNAQIAIAYTIYNRSANNYYGVSDIHMILENGYVRWMNSADEAYWDPVTYTEENPVWTWGGDNARGRLTIDSWNHALNISLAIELNNGTLELAYPIPFTGNSELPIQDYTQVYQFRSIPAWYEGYNPETRTYIDNTEYRIIGYEIVGNTVFFQHEL